MVLLIGGLQNWPGDRKDQKITLKMCHQGTRKDRNGHVTWWGNGRLTAGEEKKLRPIYQLNQVCIISFLSIFLSSIFILFFSFLYFFLLYSSYIIIIFVKIIYLTIFFIFLLFYFYLIRILFFFFSFFFSTFNFVILKFLFFFYIK